MILALFFFVGLGVIFTILYFAASTIDDIEASVEKERFDQGFGAPPSDQSHSLLVGRCQHDANDQPTEAKS